jgi:hypothetical protein
MDKVCEFCQEYPWPECNNCKALNTKRVVAPQDNYAPDWKEFNDADGCDWQDTGFYPTDLNGCI